MYNFYSNTKAVQALYGDWNGISDYAEKLLMTALSSENLEELFEQQMKEEDTSRQILLQAEQKETKAVTESSAEDIIRRALAKKKSDRDER